MNNNNKEILINILKKSKKTNKEVKWLFENFKNLEFFYKYILDGEEEIVYKILQKMKYEEYSENEVIFYKGDKSKNFFIWLEGQISAYIDKSKKIIKKDLDILNNNNKEFYNNKDFSNEFIEKNYNDEKLFIPKYKYPTIFEVGKIKTGSIFGEIGVRDNSDRKAHVIAISNCKCGILSKKNFNSIIRFFEEKFYNDDLEYWKKFLKNYLIINEIIFFFRYLKKQLLLGKGINIMKQGNKLNKLYFLKNGELLLNKNFNINSIIFPENIQDNNFKKLVYNKAKKDNLKDYKKNLNNNIMKIKGPFIFGIQEFLNNSKESYNLITLENKTTIFSMDISVFLLEFKRIN